MADASLYSGAPGIALFLLEVGASTNDPRCMHTATAALRFALSDGQLNKLSAHGFLCGKPGLMYVFARHAVATNSDESFTHATSLLRTSTVQKGTSPFDAMFGVAGSIVALLKVHELLGDSRALSRAIELGRRLIGRATLNVTGWSWHHQDPLRAHDPIGVAHGTSGCAHAFLELFAATRMDVFKHAAEQAMAFEDAFFSRSLGEWRGYDQYHLVAARGSADLDKALQFIATEGLSTERANSWCRGTPGIGLVRLRAYQLLRSRRYQQQAHAACEGTASALHETRSHCLCHGIFGNCETLLTADAVLGSKNWHGTASGVIAREIDKQAPTNQTWVHGGAGKTFDPTLLRGEAGIGLFFLRLARPDTPSVLLPTLASAPRPPAGTESSTSVRRRWSRLDTPSLMVEHRKRHFPLTLRVAAAIHKESLSQAAKSIGSFSSWVRRHTARGRNDHLAEAFRQENAVVRSDRMIRHRGLLRMYDDFRHAFARNVDWRSARVEWNEHARLLTSTYDWSMWLKSPSRGLPQRRRRPTSIVIHAFDGRPVCTLLSPQDSQIARLLRQGGDRLLRGEKSAQLTSFLRRGYEAGFLRVSSEPQLWTTISRCAIQRFNR